MGARNRELYFAVRVKSVWQGGEKHEVAEYSFVAQVNYEGAIGRDAVRVVSCNTTALCRIAHALHTGGWVKRVRAVLVRRATDPWESHENGMINTVVPETKVPSHQGPDARTVIPDLDIMTLAAAGPYNLSHIHFAMVETTRPVSVEELKAALQDERLMCDDKRAWSSSTSNTRSIDALSSALLSSCLEYTVFLPFHRLDVRD